MDWTQHPYSAMAPWLRLLFRLFSVVVTVWLCTFGATWIWYFFAPLIGGFLVAMLLHPIVTALEQRLPWKRSFLVLWILFFFVLSVVAIFGTTIPLLWKQLQSFASEWEVILGLFVQGVEKVEQEFAQWIPFDTSSWLGEMGNWVTGRIPALLQYCSLKMSELPRIFIGLFVFASAIYFFCCDMGTYLAYWKKKSSSDFLCLVGLVKSTVVTAFGGYLKAQGILSLGVFFLLMVGFFLLGQSFSLLLSLVIAVLDFIPMIGAGLILLPWAVVSILLGETTKGIGLFLLWCSTAILRRLLEPHVLGQQTGLSPLLSLGSMYVGLQVAGVWGLIFAPVVVLVVLHFFSATLFQGMKRDINTVGLMILRLFEEEK